MKHHHLALLGCSLISFFCTQSLHAQYVAQPEDGNEKKEALRKMIADRGGEANFGRYVEEMREYRSNRSSQLPANWMYIDASGSHLGDVGRTNSITLDTLNSGRFYVCTPHSGVWRTNDDGLSYTPITESLPTQSTSHLVIDPTNTNVLYLATGTHNMDMPPNSIGVFKSTDGGASWNPTGLSFAASAMVTIGDMIMNPLNHNSLLAATTDGLYRTYNGGASWTRVVNDTTYSVRFKPGDTATCYSVGHRYYRTDDAWTNWAMITSTFVNNYMYKREYAVRTCRTTPNVVYLMTAGANQTQPNFLTYIHKSTDNGWSFTIIDSLLSEPCAQFEASNYTPEKYLLGYRTTWKRAGTSAPLQQMTNWYTSPFPYMHADQRGIFFDPRNDNVAYFCNDGGLYRSTDNCVSFQNITANMELGHLYGFSQSQQANYKILTAPLDVWPFMLGSSGIDRTYTQFVEAFVAGMSPVNDSVYMLGHFTPSFTQDDWTSSYTSSNIMLGNAANFPKAFHYSACNENENYFGSQHFIYKSSDYGHTHPVMTQRQTWSNSWLLELDVSRANPNYIYMRHADSLFATADGVTFSSIGAGLPFGTVNASDLVVDPADEKKVWIAFSGYSAGNKIFFSSNAGQSWTNMSAGLPNVPVNALVCQHGIAGAVYAATDGGVFYRDDNTGSWQLFSTGLPSVMVTSLDIQYASGKLRAGTFGRGMWESDLYLPTPSNYELPPVAMFSSNATEDCAGVPVTFSNVSCGAVSSVQWLFPGGSPSSSTSPSPVVTYSAPGNYNVTLIVSGPGGNDTLTSMNYVSITAPTALPYYEPVPDLNNYIPPAGVTVIDVTGEGYTWQRATSFGASGIDDDCMMYDNYSYYLGGVEEPLILPQISLWGTAEPWLYFYRAYVLRNNAPNMHDTLKVAVRACGGTDTVLYKRGGAQLATRTGFEVFGPWLPTQPGDWVRDSIDLSAFAGEPAVIISFLDKGMWGQVIFIDEFLVKENGPAGLHGAGAAAGISIFPNPARDKVHVQSAGEQLGRILLSDISGRIISDQLHQCSSAVIDVSALAKGIYFLRVGGSVHRVEKL